MLALPSSSLPTRPGTKRFGAADGKSLLILPDGAFALKFQLMPSLQRLRAAWDCAECRFYRRAALVCAALALGTWILL
jgi:hypothetical protein